MSDRPFRDQLALARSLGVSHKRLLGWEPALIHEYDDTGRMVRTIRESEWDDVERAKMEGLALFESQVCDCGFHESVADEDPDLELDYRTCPVCAGVARAGRIQHAADDKDLGEKPAPEKVRPDDGRHIRIRPKITTG